MKPAPSIKSNVSFQSLKAPRQTWKAVDLRVKQFTLYRNKDKIQIDSKEWKALISALELVNHFIDEAMADFASRISCLRVRRTPQCRLCSSARLQAGSLLNKS